MGKWEQRNRNLDALRNALKQTPGDIELAHRYWLLLAGDPIKGEHDYRCGGDVIEAYRGAAISSVEGVVALARAYRELFENSGEAPRSAHFDDALIRALNLSLAQVSGTDRSKIAWVLHEIGQDSARP